jgi:tRNA/tmRNA/rRNA uracil-C5-methylase (TrmA/RlmC/RlmD family)
MVTAPPPSAEATLELDVGPVAHGGSCVAHHDGRVVFVRHALPGERVRAVVTDDAGDVVRADAVEVLVASAARVPPPCPYAGPGRCGGCDWQHASLAAQRAGKAQVVHEQLVRLAGLDVDVIVEPVPGDDDGLGWRTRVQLAVRDDGVPGLRRHRSTTVEPIDRCLIATEAVEAVGAELMSWPGVRGVEVIAGSGGDRAVVIEGRGRFGRLPDDVSIMRARPRGLDTLRGRPGVREVVGERTFWVGGSGFWQVHRGAPAVLAAAVDEALAPRGSDVALDLYGGVGLFAAGLAATVHEVVLVESDAGACADARTNLRDLRHARVEEGRTEQVLDRLGLGHVDVVVLDPPRRGAGARVVQQVAGLGPRRVAYVACDPASLARDLKTFAAEGFRLAALRAFDLFPMTHHVECVATLEPA